MALRARPGHRYPAQVAGTLALCFAFELADINSFAYVAPAVHHSLHLGLRAISVVTAAGFLGMFAGATAGGRVAERLGRRRALRGSVLWFSICSLATAGAFDTTSLLAARFLTGCGLGSMTVVAITYLTELVPADRRGRTQAATLGAGLLGIPAMAFFARAVIDLGPQGWRLVFVFGGLGLVPLVLTRRLPESPAWLLAQGREAEAASIAAAIERRAGSPLATTTPARVPVRELFHGRFARPTALLAIVWVLLTISYYGFASFAPTLLHEHGFTLTRSVGYTALTTLGAVPGALLAWPVADRFGLRGPVAVFSLLFAGAGVAYGLTFAPAAVVVFGFLVAALNQTLVALLYSHTPRLFPAPIRATATGLCYGAGRLANALGPLLVGQIYLTLGYTPVFVFVGACGAVIALAVLVLAPRNRAATGAVTRPSPR
ncbi:MFS transporter [Amycolatopsis rhabdoformis]|uniref:MFS transporter n=1 Tax=Amycolatopsis rhabdoformis TaxID=1448059 RepID=A0ABZ1IDI2_9PSEU|nr:MFS transporter [Amycolatopsis rhabdoformis]WSE31495.1 MFS transporter [Amycolatopsis rhabdoformis]